MLKNGEIKTKETNLQKEEKPQNVKMNVNGTKEGTVIICGQEKPFSREIEIKVNGEKFTLKLREMQGKLRSSGISGKYGEFELKVYCSTEERGHFTDVYKDGKLWISNLVQSNLKQYMEKKGINEINKIERRYCELTHRAGYNTKNSKSAYDVEG